MDINEVTEIGYSIHMMFGAMCSDALKTNSLTGTCSFACVFAKAIVEKFYAINATIRGGDGLDDGGFIDPEGNKHGHFWLELTTSEQSYIMDITVGQFGFDLPMVVPLEDSKQYLNGCQTIVDQQIAEIFSGI